MSQHEVKSLFRRTENPNSEIEYIGGSNSDGSDWKITAERAAQGIENGNWQFYITKMGIRLDIIVDNNTRKLLVTLKNVDFLELKDISF